MKRWNARSFGAGVLVSVLVFGLGVSAGATLKTAELYYNDIQLRVNGKTVVPKDAKGNTVEPFAMDGTTYLPVRAVGEALGMNVDWDGATNTVIVGNDPQMGQPAVWLDQLEPFSGYADIGVVTDGQYNSYSTANSGDTFDRYMHSYDAEYLLKGQYTSFTGTVYLSEYNKNTSKIYRMMVYLDEELVYTSEPVGSGIEPVEFDLDTTNVYKMRIHWQYSYDGESWRTGDRGSVFLGNAALWND